MVGMRSGGARGGGHFFAIFGQDKVQAQEKSMRQKLFEFVKIFLDGWTYHVTC